jgi:Phage capsid family
MTPLMSPSAAAVWTSAQTDSREDTSTGAVLTSNPASLSTFAAASECPWLRSPSTTCLSALSRQLVDDAPMLQSSIDGEMRYGLSLAEERELIFGDGTAQHILGIVPQATAYETARNVVGDTKFDTLAHAIAQSIVALLPATGIVMNINDLEALKLIKNTLGNYIGGDAGGPFGPPIRSIWGLPVVGTPIMAAGQFLVGAYADGSQIFDRMGATLMISTENEDDFVRNLATFLVEERLRVHGPPPAGVGLRRVPIKIAAVCAVLVARRHRGQGVVISVMPPFKPWRCAIVLGIVVGDERGTAVAGLLRSLNFKLTLKGGQGRNCRTVSY